MWQLSQDYNIKACRVAGWVTYGEGRISVAKEHPKSRDHAMVEGKHSRCDYQRCTCLGDQDLSEWPSLLAERQVGVREME